MRGWAEGQVVEVLSTQRGEDGGLKCGESGGRFRGIMVNPGDRGTVRNNLYTQGCRCSEKIL